jgi:hypothetical protein
METKPITDILSRWYGRPALIIGGGPSARIDLPLLDNQGFKPAVVLSGNEHGLYQGHYKVDFLVNVDRIHCARKVMMEDYLRQFNTPIINAHSWADYRLPDWKMSANSGIQAIAVGCVLGCWPVVVTGVDLFMIGRDYFHDEDTVRKTPRPRGAPPTHMAKLRVNEMRRWAGDYPVRPVSGPLTQIFPTYDPAEVIEVPKEVPYRLKVQKAPVNWYRGLKEFSFFTNDRVHPGELVPFTSTEAAPYVDKGWLELVDSPASVKL